MRGKRGALKVKPEIGWRDNNFKEQTNHAEMFVQEFREVPFVLVENYASPAMICARESALTARLSIYLFILPFIRLVMTRFSILKQSEVPLTFPSCIR